MSSSVTLAVSSLNGGDLHQRLAARLSQLTLQTDAERIYNQALRRVADKYDRDEIPNDQLDRLLSTTCSEDLLREVEDAKVRSRAARKVAAPRWLKRTGHWSLETLERFSQCTDVMVQHHAEIASLVWGGIRVLLVIARDIFDTYERLSELAMKINRCLDRFKVYIELFGPEGLLLNRLVDFHETVIDFCLQAVVAHSRGRTRTLGVATWKSIKQPFDRLLMALHYNADEVDKAANTQQMLAFRNANESNRRRDNLDSTTPDPKSFCVPKLLSKHFTGRQDILSRLSGVFETPIEHSNPRIAAIWGVPGVGKSQILHKYARETRALYQRIFFIRADGPTQILADYRMIAQELCIPDADDKNQPQRKLIEGVKRALNKSSSWLLLFDNLQDTGHVAPYLPETGTGDVLFSMRNEICSRGLADPQHTFEIEPLPVSATVDLVCHWLGTTDSDTNVVSVAKELHSVVGGLPIAVEQAAVLAATTSGHLSAVLHSLKKQRGDILNENYPTSSHELRSPTGLLFKMALEKLDKAHPQAAALLKVLVYLDTSAIPLGLLRAGSAQLRSFFDRDLTFDRGAIRPPKEEELRASGAIRVGHSQDLRSLPEIFRATKFYQRLPSSWKRVPKTNVNESDIECLLRIRFNDDVHLQRVLEDHDLLDSAFLHLQCSGLLKRNNINTVSIHDLIRDIHIELIKLEGSAVYQVNSLCALTLIFLAYPVPQRYNRMVMRQCQSYLPHALSALRFSEGFSVNTVVGPELMYAVASTMDLMNRSNLGIEKLNAIQWYCRAYCGYRAAWNTLQLQKRDVQTILAGRREFDRELRGACFQRMTTGYERFGQAPHRTFNTFLKVSSIFVYEKNWATAEQWAEIAYRGYVMLYDDFHELTYETLAMRFHIAACANDWELALDTALSRTTVFERLYGSIDNGTDGAACAAAVGDAFEHLERYDEALGWRQRCLNGWRATYGWNKPQAMVVVDLARVYRKLHRHSTAKLVCRAALSMIFKEELLRLPTDPQWTPPSDIQRQDDSPCDAEHAARYGLAISLEALGEVDHAGPIWTTLFERTSKVSMAAPADKIDFIGNLRVKIIWNLCRFLTASGQGFPTTLEHDVIVEVETRYGPFKGSFIETPELILPTDIDF